MSVLLFFSTPVFAQPEPVPFQCSGQAFTVRFSPAELYEIDQDVDPFTFNPIATFTTELNNLGYRSTDDLLYAMELNVTGKETAGNNGVVMIDSTGAVFPFAVSGVAIPSGIRFPAGDVSPDGSTMYIAAQTTSGVQSDPNLYLVNLATGVVSSVPRTIITTGLNVADWAVSPVDGNLYGAMGKSGTALSGGIFKMTPAGVTSQVAAASFLPSGGATLDAYGGAWFDAQGHLYLYRNVGEIYKIDLTGPTIVNIQSGGPESTFNDAAACADPTPAISIAKTVYAGHDSGASAPGGEFVDGAIGDPVTYVFSLTNIGNVTLENLILNDGDLNITLGDLTLLSGSLPLASGESLVYFYDSTIGGNLVNEACVTGTPTTEEACDTAAVLAPTVIEVGCSEGCTPGFWKNHRGEWVGYAPSEFFDAIFGVGPHVQLRNILKTGGGTEDALNRHAVAALLNANASIDYPYTTAEVIAMVQCAYDTACSEWDFMTLKEHFEGLTKYCPLY